LVEPCIGPRSANRDRVDIASDNACPQQASRCNGQYAGAGADIEHAPELPPLRQIGECEQAAAGCPMMTSTEGECGFDLDADIIRLPLRAVVCAMDEEAAGAHRPEAGKALGDPVGRGDPLNAKGVRYRFAGCELDQLAQTGLVRSSSEMDRQLPASIIAFKSGTGSVLGIEAFGEISG
jgi:hypothetical protein